MCLQNHDVFDVDGISTLHFILQATLRPVTLWRVWILETSPLLYVHSASMLYEGHNTSTNSTLLNSTQLSLVDASWFMCHLCVIYATFREKGATLACTDQLGVFLSLTLYNKPNFYLLQRIKYDGLEKM